MMNVNKHMMDLMGISSRQKSFQIQNLFMSTYILFFLDTPVSFEAWSSSLCPYRVEFQVEFSNLAH